MKRYKTIYTFLLTGILTMSVSCQHKELCFDHDIHAPKTDVRIITDYENEWELPCEGGPDWKNYATWTQDFAMSYDDLRPADPTGLRVQIYNDDGSNNVLNVAPEGDIIRMRPGEHSILFYNNGTQSIVFDGMNAFSTAKATTRTRANSSYKGNSLITKAPENPVNEPDMLYGNYLDHYLAERTVEVEELPVTMHPLVFTYLVRYEFSHGLEYVASARGALAGMSSGVWLHSGRTLADEATILYSCTLQDFGAQALVQSFGIPDYPNENYVTKADERKYFLQLEVILKNGKELEPFEFDVTDQVANQPQGGVIIVDGIEVSDKDGLEGGSGFDVDIDGWEDFNVIELPLK